MSVDNWARREAERRYPALVRGEDERYDDFEARLNEHDAAADAFSAGITHAFYALLSDEAASAAAWALTGADDPLPAHMVKARAAIDAAIDAVTKEARND